MNILLSSAGRQSFLVEAFREALNGRGKVFAADFDPTAEALNAADSAFAAPAYSDAGYINWITNICQKHAINLLMSLNIDDLIILKQSEELFSSINCCVVGANFETVIQTNDKYQLPILSEELGLPRAQTYLVTSNFNTAVIDKFPIIAKPRFGKGARGNIVIKNRKELEDFKSSIAEKTSYVLQEFIEGDEYGFDVVNALNGNFMRLLGRKKISQQNGESFQATTINPVFWEEAAKKWSNKLKHTGTANFDVIFKNGKGYLIDLNLRFSGDYIFSHIAGANTPQLLVNNLLSIPVDDNSYHPKINVTGERTENGAKFI